MLFSGNRAEQLKAQLIYDINESHLPISLGYYVVKDVFNTFHIEYLNYLAKEGADDEIVEETKVVIDKQEIEEEE